jgi:TfoX/Sxy family transcriptional regulator of competence genes
VVARKDRNDAMPADRLELYDRLIEMQPGVARKGATIPYTSVNGHMFSYLNDGHLVLRLASGGRETFLERYATTLHAAHSIVQKEYVDVPDTLFADPAELAPFFRSSYAYVAALRPKPTARRSTR